LRKQSHVNHYQKKLDEETKKVDEQDQHAKVLEKEFLVSPFPACDDTITKG